MFVFFTFTQQRFNSKVSILSNHVTLQPFTQLTKFKNSLCNMQPCAVKSPLMKIVFCRIAEGVCF